MRVTVILASLLVLIIPFALMAEEKGMSEEELSKFLTDFRTMTKEEFSRFLSDFGTMSTEEFLKAAEGGDVTQVKALLGIGVNTEVRDLKGTTALMIASRNNHLDIVQLLLKNRAKVDTWDKNGLTPLMHAIPHPRIVEALLQHGASVRLKNFMGETALDRAKDTFFGTPNEKTVQLLQEAKKKQDKVDEEWRKAIEEALSE